MDKSEAIRIIFESAKLYGENLENKNLLFITSVDNNKFNFIETRFLPGNYLHLTGVTKKNRKINAKEFYNKCLNRKLNSLDFDFKDDGTTVLKLSVLPQLMNIFKNVNMIGNFNGSKPRLYADKLAGNIRACLGFRIQENYYVPVTVVKEDMRNLIFQQERIIGIFSKDTNSSLYTNIVYSAKGVKNIEENLTDEILLKLDVNNLVDKTNRKLIIPKINLKTTIDASQDEGDITKSI